MVEITKKISIISVKSFDRFRSSKTGLFTYFSEFSQTSYAYRTFSYLAKKSLLNLVSKYVKQSYLKCRFFIVNPDSQELNRPERHVVL